MSDADARREEFFALECIYGPEQISTFLNDDGLDVLKTDIAHENIGFTVEFTLPSDYPSASLPLIELHTFRGMSPSYRVTLCSLLAEQGELMKGTPLLFHYITVLNEWLQDYVSREKSFDPVEDTLPAIEDDTIDSEDEVRPVFDTFTPLTKELFNEWNQKYRQHLATLVPPPILTKDTKGKKRTGRQLFETDLSLAQLDQEDDVMEIDFALFELENEEQEVNL